MHTLLPFILVLILLIVFLTIFANQLKIAYPILLVLAGLAISFVPGLPLLKIDPDLIFFVFLPPLLYEAAWGVSFKEMKKWWRIIGSFAFLVVFFTAFLVAIISNQIIPGFSLALGLCPRGNCLPSRCRQHRGNHQIREDPQINNCHSRRRKPFERRIFLNYLPFCSGSSRNRTIYLARGRNAIPMDAVWGSWHWPFGGSDLYLDT